MTSEVAAEGGNNRGGSISEGAAKTGNSRGGSRVNEKNTSEKRASVIS